MARRPPPSPRDLWDEAATTALLAGARAVTANSRWARAWYAERCPPARRARVVYYGVPLARPAAAPARAPFVLAPCRLAEYKGVDVLAMALAQLRAGGVDVPAVVVGRDHSAGAFQAFLRRLGVADLVTVLPPMAQPRLLGLMRRARVCVLPSRRDSLGGAALEAMAQGTPVVASRVGGLPELVRHRREGLLVPPQDPAALGRALTALWDDAALRRRLGRAARSRARGFTWASWCRRHDRLLSRGARGELDLIVWGPRGDHTAEAFRDNAAAGLSALGWRVRPWSWPDGRPAAPPPPSPRRAALVMLHRSEEVGRLSGPLAAAGVRPVVALC